MKIRLAVLFIFFCGYVFSQYSKEFQPPKTPEVFLFEKYGNVPISSYNGKPNIKINLHNVRHGDISFDLDLTYSSNGIRVDEEASNYGLGWYFSTGMISQTVQDIDDLDPARVRKLPDYLWASSIGYPIFPNPQWDSETGNYYSNSIPNNSTTRVVRNVSSFSDQKYFITRLRSEGSYENTTVYYNKNMQNFYEPLMGINSKVDLSLDYFTANFFGHNLTFVIEEYGIKIINNKGYKVEKINNFINSALTRYKWKITAPDGISYFFDEEKITEYFGGFDSYSSTNVTNENTGYKTFIPNTGANYGLSKNKSRIWKITKIEDSKGNQVLFNYENLTKILSGSSKSGECNLVNVSSTGIESVVLGPFSGSYTTSNYSGPNLSGTNGSIRPKLGGNIYTNFGGQVLLQEKSVLKEIVYSNVKLEFKNEDRVDIPFDKKYIGLNVLYQGVLKKEVKFNYDYFNSSSSDDLQKRLKLNSLTIGNLNYSFKYNNLSLPNKNSNSFDYWGFYNGMPNTSSISNPLRLYQNSSSIPIWSKQFLPVLNNIANRSAHPDYCKAGLLEKITYPTGGSTEFLYELNEFNNYFIPNYDNKIGVGASNSFLIDYPQGNSRGYGLRVKESIDYDSDNVVKKKKKYNYYGGKHIPAFVGFNNIDRFKTITNLGRSSTSALSYNREYFYGDKITSYHSTTYQSSILGNGDYVGYDSVSIEEIDILSNSNGKTIEYFTNIPDVDGRQKFSNGGAIGPYSALEASFCDSFGQSIRNTDVDNGLLIKKEFYNKNGTLVKKIDFSYKSEVFYPYSGYDVKVVNLPGSYGFMSGDSSNIKEEIFQEFLFLYFPFKLSKSILKEEKTTDYYTTGSLTNVVRYSFDSNDQITGIVKSNPLTGSFNEERTTFATYPNSILQKNILNLPSSKIIFTNNTIKEQANYKYEDFSNNVVLKKISICPKGNPDPSKTKSVFYDKYDDKGNLLQYTPEGGAPISIIWGHNKTLPIAKIENATYAQVEALAGFGVGFTITSDLSTAQEATLRNNLPNAMVTTYTYLPLVGVTAITDSKGLKTSYEYDVFNRLKWVKDHQGYVLQKYCYNYKGEIINCQ